MIGQGGPNAGAPSGHFLGRAASACKRRSVFALAVCAAAVSLLGRGDAQERSPRPPGQPLPRIAQPAPLDLRLRVAWGGGAGRLWEAEFELSAGALSQPVRLSMEADAPGAMALEGERRLRLWQRSPSSYDGADFSVLAPRDAVLTVRLTPRDGAGGEVRQEIPLAELIEEIKNVALDERQNHLLVRRAPGDRLRVHFARDSLVFAPGERFEIQAAPQLAGFAPQTRLTGTTQLLPADGGASVWSQAQELTVAEDGSVPATGPMIIPMPREEGVYNLVLRLEPHGSAAANRPALERLVQLVVIDNEPPAPAEPDAEEPVWRAALEIDPANPKWWERLIGWPQLPKWLPGFGEQELASGPLQTERRGERRFVRLEPGGWRAFPLPLGWTPGPHLVEITYPTDARQALGVSVVEPNSAGEVTPLGLDSGVVVTPRDLGGAAPSSDAVGVHRLTFWPRTEAPVLLLTNQGRDIPAFVGRIRVLRGPERLPPAPGVERVDESSQDSHVDESLQDSVFREVSEKLPDVDESLRDSQENESGRASSPWDRRLLAAWFDRPLFPENFSAPQGLDEGTDRSLDDWSTFYLGAVRMIEYLKSRGYNAAAVSVWCEGSTIYPSRLLEPTPKYDTGTLFVSGQDPRRKDVLEMLLRLCDREGIRLIPALQFSTPLPAMEKLTRGDAADAEGLAWVNWCGRTWLQERGAVRGLAPYYNPLDDRVQGAIADVVQELVDRYGRHPSFGGVALQLGPESYALLPGQFWGYDDRTIGQFAQDTGAQVPGEGDLRHQQRDRWLAGEGKAAWLAWRAERMAQLYRTLGRTVAEAGPQARLYLAGVDLTRCEPVEAMMRPALPRRARFAEAMLHLGLDPSLWKDQPNVVLPRPRRIEPATELPHRAVSVEIDAAADTAEFFAAAGQPAGLFYYGVRPMRLEAFDQVSPFDPQKTYTWLAPHLSLHGAENRRRFAHLWAQSDVRTLFEGGWMLPLGQEESLQSLLDVYRGLPDVAFETVAPTMGAAAQPVVVRQKSHAGKTWVYVVNDSPWPAAVELELKAPADCTLARLPDGAPAPLERRGPLIWWKVELAPYDAAGAVLSSPEARVVDYLATLPPETLNELRAKIRDIGARQYPLRDVQAQTYAALSNPGFEKPASGGQIPGWEYGGARDSVAIDATRPHEGQASLRLKSPSDKAPTWLRSEVLKPPPSGKLTLSVRVRAADASQPPELRLSAQWMYRGALVYRPVFFGRGSQFPLTTDWIQYHVHIPLPPAEITDLRVGVDVLGPGEVWIDQVRLYDAWFEDTERDELMKLYGGAETDLSHRRIADCLRFLEGYWSQFLQTHVEPPPPSAAEPPQAEPAAVPAKPRMLDRLRRWSPRRLLPFS